MVDNCAMVQTPGALGLPARALNGLRTVYVVHVSRASNAVLRVDTAEACGGLQACRALAVQPQLRNRPGEAERDGVQAGRGDSAPRSLAGDG